MARDDESPQRREHTYCERAETHANLKNTSNAMTVTAATTSVVVVVLLIYLVPRVVNDVVEREDVHDAKDAKKHAEASCGKTHRIHDQVKELQASHVGDDDEESAGQLCAA
eukprot:CAMPEP_0198717612 /NCGR_PEP_ID=MMETSP1471-20131121/45608_1 /TAXON_ID=41880 /ORGANISM="Pycnococcus provasolii, Strain RCC733" /LENGTH=110 /DNA_ID=CAMNT_0044478219 /DNA_START=119 /DNA_END=452 /DNA_ORIENTATION=-